MLAKIKRVGSNGDLLETADDKAGSGQRDEETVDLTAALGKGKKTTKGVLAKIKRVGTESNIEVETARVEGKGAGAAAAAEEAEGTIDLSAALGKGKKTTKGVLAKIRRVGTESVIDVDEGQGNIKSKASRKAHKGGKKGKRRVSTSKAPAVLETEEGLIDLSAALGKGKKTTKDVLAKIQRVGSKKVLVLELDNSGGKSGKSPKKAKKAKKGKAKRRSSVKAAAVAVAAAKRARPAVEVPVGAGSPEVSGDVLSSSPGAVTRGQWGSPLASDGSGAAGGGGKG